VLVCVVDLHKRICYATSLNEPWICGIRRGNRSLGKCSLELDCIGYIGCGDNVTKILTNLATPVSIIMSVNDGAVACLQYQLGKR